MLRLACRRRHDGTTRDCGARSGGRRSWGTCGWAVGDRLQGTLSASLRVIHSAEQDPLPDLRDFAPWEGADVGKDIAAAVRRADETKAFDRIPAR